MNIKKTVAVLLATAFIHFRDAATNAKLYVANEDKPAGAVDGEDGFARDTNGEKLPVGVEVYGPGSTQYRNAQSAIATANIKRGKKGLTGDILRENETELLARTTAKFVNFDYNGAAASYETNIKFYDDLELAHFREQVVEQQGDFGTFLPSAATA